MVLAISGAQGLFSTLYQALKMGTKGKPSHICLTRAVHLFLNNFRVLVQQLSEQPT